MNLELSKIETEALISLLAELSDHQSVAGCNDSFVPDHWTFDECAEYAIDCVSETRSSEDVEEVNEIIEDSPESSKYLFGISDLEQTNYFITKLKELL